MPSSREERPQRLVVVGGGPAAQRLLERLVESNATDLYEVLLFCEEAVQPYDRVHLGRVLEGAEGHQLALRGHEWYAAHGVGLRLKEKILEIDVASKRLRSDIGAEIEYDKLVLATGGEAFVPPIEGVDLEGVLPYRSLEDVEAIHRRAAGAGRAVIVGGGLLGLEAARALQGQGLAVEVIEMAPRLLPRQLDVEGADVLEQQVRDLGLGLHVGRRISGIQEASDGLGVLLDDGHVVEGQMVVLATGIRPRDSLAQEASLECHPSGGVVVDDRLATSAPDIFAIGECVRHRGETYGFVGPCYQMAEALASCLMGGSDSFDGAVPSARLKVDEIDVVTVGESLADGIGVSAKHWVQEGVYRRVVLRDRRVVGAIAVGGGSDFPRLQEAVARKVRLKEWQNRRFERTGHLWRKRAESPIRDWDDAAVVCTCTGVTCGALRNAQRAGACGQLGLSEHTGAGGVCGSCMPLLAELAGEEEGGRRRGVGRTLAAFGALALGSLALAFSLGPLTYGTSVQSGGIDFLWRDAWWKQATGFTLVGVSALSLLFSLRKRWKWFRFSSFSRLRVLHSVMGVATIAILGLHTGFRLGSNLNRALMVCFLALVALGSLAALVTSLESRLPAPFGGALRRAWTAAHVFVFWPVPVLAAFHVLAVYFY